MSKADLKALVQKARKQLEGTNDLYRKRYNTAPHVFKVSKNSIKNQILIQIGRTRKSITEGQSKALDEMILVYTKSLYSSFKSRKSNTFTYDVVGREDDFYVVIRSNNPSSDIFRQIAKIREERGLSILRNKVVKLFPKVTKEDTKHLLEIGHSEGHSVSEIRIAEALSNISEHISIGAIKEADTVLNLIMTSAEKVNNHSNGTLKEFTIQVEDEALKSNRGLRSAGENQLLVTARKVLDNFIDNTDWANQKGSNSAVELAIDVLLDTAKKSGAKKVRRKKSKAKSSTSTVKDKVVISNKSKQRPVVIANNIGTLGGIGAAIETKTNWASLVNILNKKLPQKVANNMGEPGLVYRTGRFANSTKIVGIETTKEGYPSIIFDYQRDPYDVFDRVRGKQPWNTPARDPRALVDKSVRQLVQELAIGRFYTRRA